MIYDYLVVGQGIAGSMIAYQAMKRGRSVMVIDQFNPNSASNIATGVINPVTGRKLSRSWMIDTVMPFAKKTYREIETQFNIHILYEQPIFRVFSSFQDVEVWQLKKAQEAYSQYLGEVHLLEGIALAQPFGAGEILQTCWVNIPLFIKAFRDYLKQNGSILEEKLEYNKLNVSGEISYKEIRARHIIFCEGYKGKWNPYFADIPLSHAKGELLTISAPGLRSNKILNRNIFIAPLGGDNYMVGSTFIWNDTEENVTDIGRQEILSKLDKMITVPYRLISENAGIRPTITDRRPVLGASKMHRDIYLFNGLGTKGISLAPFFSDHLLDHIEKKTNLIPECDIARFRKIKNLLR